MSAALAAEEQWKQRYLQLLHMPLSFNGLVVESTTRCNAKCSMCYQAAGPKGSDQWGKAAMSVAEISGLLDQAIELDTMFPRFHLSGGEAFLDIDACLALFRHAAQVGFLDITTTTNGYWALQPARASALASSLRKAGVTSLEISWDVWHLPYVKPIAVEHCIAACADVGIETNLRVLSTRSHDYHEALGLLKPDILDRADRVTCGPVFATGRAKREIPADDFHYRGDVSANCHSVLNLTVNAQANVFPCCAGIDQTDNYLFGNIRANRLKDIVEGMNASPLLRVVVFGGVASLLPLLKAASIELPDRFQNICHLCWTIFSQRDCVDAIETTLVALQAEGLRSAIESMESRASELSACS